MEFGYTPVKFHKAHSEFYDYIESFPDAKPETEIDGLPMKQVRLDALRRELLELATNPQQIQDRLCYRTCFKWRDREYINFCLQQQCGGANFFAAARTLGLTK